MTTLLVLFYFVVPISADPRGGLLLRSLVAVVVFAALGAVVLAQVKLVLFDAEHHLDGLVLAIALIWVLFSLAYYVMAHQQPDQVSGLHTRLDALYFTASTILTIGFGDVHASGQAARVLVLVQMAFDVVFVTAGARVISGRVRGRTHARAGLAVGQPRAEHLDGPAEPH
jgi:hypothetical protein